jgi:hypothetical protein
MLQIAEKKFKIALDVDPRHPDLDFVRLPSMLHCSPWRLRLAISYKSKLLHVSSVRAYRLPMYNIIYFRLLCYNVTYRAEWSAARFACLNRKVRSWSNSAICGPMAPQQ